MIRTYEELKQIFKDIDRGLPKSPFSTSMKIDSDGCFISDKPMLLQPEEALSLGKFLVKFYGPQSEKE